MATDIDTTGRPTKTDVRRLRAEARASDQLLADVYEDGRREGRREGRSQRRHRPRSSRSVRNASRSARRSAAAVRRSARSGAGGTSFIGLVVLSLVLVALYSALRNAHHVGGFLGGLRRAVEWLSDPTATIPYGGTAS